MKSSKKIILFSSAFFISLTFLMLISNIFRFINPVLNPITVWAIYSFTFFFFIWCYSFLRHNTLKRSLAGKTVYATANLSTFTFREKSWLYLFPILIYFLPSMMNRSIKYISLSMIVMFVFTMVILELFIRLSQNSMKIYFTNEGILINGIDLRLPVPRIYGSVFHNDSGFHEYSEFKEYFPLPNQVDIYRPYDLGAIHVLTSGDSAKQIQGILSKNKLKIKKFK
ncbi:MAG: hypothetical protein N4A40_14100 [Tissierellales bacterium]|jgi:hypothetical protein|nr:hypothetical protein [Tissierellales bacterium]